MTQSDSTEETIFEAARHLGDPEKQAAYLDLACGKDQALRQRIEQLLRAGQRAKDFFQKQGATLPLRLPQAVPATPVTEGPGSIIGRYKLLQQIGEGGCGVVYMAEQEEPVRRRVALKVIKLGMDTKQVIARFEAERQALALMDHPNIAKVLDAGATDTGRPYFVMELVRGVRITDYCDEANLSTADRLKLFIQVCQAIQHAHQKGIIHRDIKPSNILVTINDGVPVPKVIDFGIAKATQGRLTDQTLFTAFEQFIGTPAYMSPEQAVLTSLDIDTRSDIYSLGVLLYELLTGKTPFDQKQLLAAGLDEMRRTILEQEPPKPSTRLGTMLDAERTATARHHHTDAPKLIHLLRGDLDWIVMKSLDKDRGRRYETASGLASDIRRHLNNEPVVARPRSRLYEFQKTVRRHKFGFAAAGALILVLAAGVVVSTSEAIRATRAEREQARQRQIAETKEKENEQVAQFLKYMLEGVGPSRALGRDTAMLREILDKSAQRLNDLKGQPAVEANMRATLGNVYADLGEYTDAAATHREALALRKKLLGDEHRDVATSLRSLASVLQKQGRLAEAETTYRESLAISRKLFGSENLAVAECLLDLSLLLRQRNPDEAVSTAREALAINRKLLGDEHPRVASAIQILSWNVNMQGKSIEAEALARERLAILRQLRGNEPLDVSDLATFLQDQGKWAEAEAVIAEALASTRKMPGKETLDVAGSLHQLDFVLGRQNKWVEAETVVREVLRIRRKILGNQHPDVAAALNALGLFLTKQEKYAEAETTLREALAIQQKRSGNDNPETYSIYLLSDLFRAQGKLTEAEAAIRETLMIQGKLLGNEHPDLRHPFHSLTDVLCDLRRLDEAETAVREELALTRKLGNEHPHVIHAVLHLAEVLIREGKYAEAETLLREDLARQRKLFGNESPDAFTLQIFGVVLSDSGQWTEAEAAFRESVVIRRKLLGNEHLNLGHALHCLAGALNHNGKRAEAEALSREELAIRRKLLGNDHSEVAVTLCGLAVYLRGQGKLAEAEIMASEALAIRQKRFANDNLDLIYSLNLLSDLLRAQGKLAEAKALIEGQTNTPVEKKSEPR